VEVNDMAKEVSVSLAYSGMVTPEHDLRQHTPANADRKLTNRNVVIVDCPEGVKQAVNDFYGPSIEAYNAKQKRADRKKSADYYGSLLDGTEGYGKGKAQEKPIYEYVLQFGNKDDNGVTDSDFSYETWEAYKQAGEFGKASAYAMKHLNKDKDREALKQILVEEAKQFQERYPNFKVIYAVYHDDEPGGTGHVHIGFTPFCTHNKTGLDTRCSLRGALREMGIQGVDGQPALETWKNDVKDRMTAALQAKGFDRKFMSNEEERLSVSNFKRREAAKRLQEENARLQAENERLQQEAEELASPVRRFIGAIKGDKNKEAEERQRAAEELAAAKEQAENARRAAQEAAERAASLQRDKDTMREENHRLRASKREIEAKLETAQQENAQLQAKLKGKTDGERLIAYMKATGQYEPMEKKRREYLKARRAQASKEIADKAGEVQQSGRQTMKEGGYHLP